MSSPTTTNPAEKTSPPRPVANTMPRRVSFGATSTPERLPNSRTAFKKSSSTSLEVSKLHRTLLGHAVVGSMTEFKIDKMKPMSAQDKECEAEMAKLYKEKSKTGLAGKMNWLQGRVKDGDAQKK